MNHIWIVVSYNMTEPVGYRKYISKSYFVHQVLETQNMLKAKIKK